MTCKWVQSKTICLKQNISGVVHYDARRNRLFFYIPTIILNYTSIKKIPQPYNTNKEKSAIKAYTQEK